MIDSALFSRSTIFELGEEIKGENYETEKKVNKSTLYHMIQSFVSAIHQKKLSTI